MYYLSYLALNKKTTGDILEELLPGTDTGDFSKHKNLKKGTKILDLEEYFTSWHIYIWIRNKKGTHTLLKRNKTLLVDRYALKLGAKYFYRTFKFGTKLIINVDFIWKEKS